MAAGAGRRAGISAGRAGDSRNAGHSASSPEAGHRNLAVVFATFGAGSAAHFFRIKRTSGDSRHQRGGDFADGAGHSLRGGYGYRAAQSLQRQKQSADAANREDFAGQCQSARRTLRSRRAGHLRAALYRRRFQRALCVHRSRDLALILSGCDSAAVVAGLRPSARVSVH